MYRDIMNTVYSCIFACCLLICVQHGLAEISVCGPYELCACVSLGSSGLSKMDCSQTNLHLLDVCNYTSTIENITEVIFDSNNVSSIEIHDVNGCEFVEVLTLRNTTLGHIAPDAFIGMKHLRLLDLSQNLLDSYSGTDVDYLNNIASLKELRLQDNFKPGRLTNISYPGLSNLLRLEILYMDGLQDVAFPEDYLSLPNLTSLSLSGLHGGICHLGELVNTTFNMTPHLEQLDLSNCSITNIHAGTFKVLHSLTRLDISMNEQLGFDSMRNISYSLQYTKIDFLNATKLHTTFGLGNIIRIGDVCNLRNTTLRELVLDSNRIQVLETNIFLVMPATLQIIHMRDNKFTFGLYLLQLACLSNVTIVHAESQNFAHAPLHYIDDPLPKTRLWSYVPHLDCPYVTPDYLYNLSQTIPNCQYFKTDKIKQADLYSAAFPTTLKHIDFFDSDMKYIALKYPIQPFNNHIEYIDLSGNILYSWIGPIGPFPHLTTLNMSRTYSSYIGSEFFLYMTSLKYLHIEKNFIGIPLADDKEGSIFKPLRKLEYLDISANQIRFLPPKVFIHLTKLQVLNISINSITTWTAEVQTLSELKYLDIQLNALSELPLSLMSHFDDIQENQHRAFSINMRNNPIRCSCKYERFLTWMVKHQSSFIGFEHYNFTDDSGNPLSADSFIHQVENFSKTCRSFTLVIILCTVGVTFFISLIICGLIYKNRWKLRYFLFMNKRRFFGYRAIPEYEPIDNFRYDAFISYAEENIRFILDGIIPNLENKGLNLCIHQRDFIAGNAVTDNIINAIQSSRKTVVVLSRHFLKSKWCRYEFQMARMESIYSRDGNSSVIIVMLENMPPNKLMPLEMIEWIKQESYIEYTDDEQGKVLFWENIERAILQ